MRIITGSTGTAHITSADDAAFNVGVVGPSDYLFNITNFDVTQVGTNSFKLSKAEICIAGRHGRIEGTEIVTIEDGSQGMYRKDAIVIEYVNNSGLETMEALIIKGTPSASKSGAAVPSIYKGDTYNGATRRQMHLATIELYENTVEAIKIVANTIVPVTTVAKNVSDLSERVDTLISDAGLGTEYRNDESAVPAQQDTVVTAVSVALPAGLYVVSYGIASQQRGFWDYARMSVGSSAPSRNAISMQMTQVYDYGLPSDQRIVNANGSSTHGLCLHDTTIIKMNPSGATANLNLYVQIGKYTPSAGASAVTSINAYIRAVRIG